MRIQFGTFEWAIGQMKNGERVRREPWPRDEYCFISGSDLKIADEDGTDIAYFSNSCLATDWEIYRGG
jgi:hypothetical protein